MKSRRRPLSPSPSRRASRLARRRTDVALPAESPAAEYATVGWALTTLSTLLCEVGVVAVALWLGYQGRQLRAEALLGILLLAALVMGLAGQVLLCGMCALRHTRPTLGILVSSGVVCAAPLALTVWRWFS